MKYNIEEQRKNAQRIMENYWTYSDNKILEDGTIAGFFEADKSDCFSIREALWVAYSLIARGRKADIDRTNKLIRGLKWVECHFSPMICLQILLRYSDRLDSDVKKLMRSYVKDRMKDVQNGCFYEFVGVNDNFPFMAVVTTVIGGEMFGDEKALEWGKNNLKNAQKILKRRGMMSEPLSPTYTAVQLTALAELVNYARDKEVVQIALYIENRIWESVFAFYHYQMGKMAAPYSRAYLIDSVGSAHMMDFLLYIILGNKVPFDTIKEKFFDERRIIHGSIWFELVQFAMLAQTEYHCNIELIEKAFSRKFPYVVMGSCEYSSSRPDHGVGVLNSVYPAGEAELTSYMTNEYVLSSATVPFHSGGQSECFYMQYKKQEKIKETKDIQTVYARYVVNNSGPDYEMLWDRGRKAAAVNENISFTAYRPSKSIVGESVFSLKLAVILPKMSNKKPEIIEKDGIFYISENKTSFAIIPLSDVCKCKIEENERFTYISLYNYDGERKVVTEQEYYEFVNGFCFVAEDKISFGEFLNKKINIKEKTVRCAHSRDSIMKNIYLEYDGKSIEFEYDNECLGVKYCLIDDKLRELAFFETKEL